LAEQTEGEMAMISPETQTSRLLRKAASLLNSVAEAAWAVDAASPTKWDLHRIGTEAYLAQRDILDLLGLPGVMAGPQADFDIAVALDEATQVMARIPEEFETLVTQQLLGRVSLLAERVGQSRCYWPKVDTSRYLGKAPAGRIPQHSRTGPYASPAVNPSPATTAPTPTPNARPPHESTS
jgi:hypothetical protein